METKQDTKRQMNFSRQDCEAQWNLFADEYDIPEDGEQGVPAASISMKAVKEKLIQAMMRGRVAIVEDAKEGIVVKQYIQHTVEGLPSGNDALVYVAPTVNHVSQMGWGTNNESAQQMRLARVAAALTNKSEPLICRMKGGDRARMELIANLFMSA